MNRYAEPTRLENAEFSHRNRGFRSSCVFTASPIMECVVDLYLGSRCGFVGLVVLVGFLVEARRIRKQRHISTSFRCESG